MSIKIWPANSPFQGLKTIFTHNRETELNTRIRLDLKRHCIQTACRCLYNASLNAYFKTGDETDQMDRMRIESRIELLQKALSDFDFGYLRSRFPELSGHTEANIDLELRRDGQIEILINGIRVDASKSKL